MSPVVPSTTGQKFATSSLFMITRIFFNAAAAQAHPVVDDEIQFFLTFSKKFHTDGMFISRFALPNRGDSPFAADAKGYPVDVRHLNAGFPLL